MVKAIKRQVVKAVAEHVHHAKGANQRERNCNAGNNCGGQVAQEKENDHHHQRHREHQFELDVGNGGADGRGPIGQSGDLDRRWQSILELIQKGFDTVHNGDDVRAGLALNIHDDGGNVVHPGCLTEVFHVVIHRGDIGHLHRGAVPVGHHQWRVISGRE